MTIRVVPEARLELRDAVDYYEKQQSGLGRLLWREADEHILWVSLNPEVPRLRPAGYRRVNLRVFPYYIAYIVRRDIVWIIAIGHSHRRPEYWIERKQNIDLP
ncbi:MAG: type II toxin-antitoxin system RelE/ParE family toxin [Lacunisphaera sp.]|nr:type II toxin-antitoxin system RelE/ParE family toxin [Lacunisphaera sp.]